MISLALRFSAVLALLLTVTNIAVQEFSINGNDLGKNIATMFSFFFMIVLLFFGMKSIRISVYDNAANYGQVFFSGFIISLLTVVGVGITTIIYFQFVRPDFASLIIPVAEKKMMELGAKPEEIKKEIDLIRNGFSVSNAFAGIAVYTLIVMLLISVVLAAFIRTRDTFTEDPR